MKEALLSLAPWLGCAIALLLYFGYEARKTWKIKRRNRESLRQMDSLIREAIDKSRH